MEDKANESIDKESCKSDQDCASWIKSEIYHRMTSSTKTWYNIKSNKKTHLINISSMTTLKQHVRKVMKDKITGSILYLQISCHYTYGKWEWYNTMIVNLPPLCLLLPQLKNCSGTKVTPRNMLELLANHKEVEHGRHTSWRNSFS